MDHHLLAKVLALRDDLAANLLERETAIEAALLTFLTGEHLLLLGPPGTAKSLLVRSICHCIEGATCFERLLTRFSTPEEIFLEGAGGVAAAVAVQAVDVAIGRR